MGVFPSECLGLTFVLPLAGFRKEGLPRLQADVQNMLHIPLQTQHNGCAAESYRRRHRRIEKLKILPTSCNMASFKNNCRARSLTKLLVLCA